MGFDIYGLNPHNPNNAVKPTIDPDDNPTETEWKEYFKAIDDYEKVEAINQDIDNQMKAKL